ncbi:MAG TPA: histidine kinase [Thermoanaerobaculia bacterium]|nr:histidine kinase [Thermoanaerobaculia bacterium]
MHPNQLQYARGERIIAAGRLLLAVFSLVALLLDRDVTSMATLPFAVVIVLYSLVLAGFAWRFPFATPKLRMLLHVADFLLPALLIFTTHAAVSRFFVFFTFSIFSALVRFGVRGTLYTSGAAILTYLALALIDDRMQSDAGYLVLRVVSLTVITLFLVYIGALHERVRDELARLASWPRPASGSREEVVRETLALARDVLHAPRALLAWEDQEEPWVWCAVSRDETGDETRLTREPPGFLDAPELQERLGTGAVISTPVTGDTMQGRLFFLDRDDFTYDDVTLSEIVGRLVAIRIDQLNVAERMRAAAVGEERIRVARDLHDGVLQSLTGAALQLQSVHNLVGDDEARRRLRRVQELLEHDQRELRSLITHLRPATAERRVSPLETRLAELAQRFERQWDVAVAVTIEPPFPPLRDELSGAIYNIVHEAVANAARHARATRIDATVRSRDGGGVEIVVTDDGHGFPFHGDFDLAELDELHRGPATLKERVASLGGELVLHSAPSGATLEIRI